jgi:Rrf2 family cysteine metabolism transcriptional repressor
MIKLSTKGRYASRAVLEMALGYGKGPILLREIAQKQDISERYLERIMNTLVSAGIIQSTRGQNGGFSLKRPPSDITLATVIEAVEGQISPVTCVDNPESCPRHPICVTRDIWIELKSAMMNLLNSITLHDMVGMYHHKNSTSEHQMYYI